MRRTKKLLALLLVLLMGTVFFTSASAIEPPDTTPPTVVAVTPTGENAPITGSLVIKFSEPIKTTGTILLGDTPPSLFDVYIFSKDRTVVTTSYRVAEYGTNYVIKIAGFKDDAGNEMIADSSRSFTTVNRPAYTVSVTDGTGGGSYVQGAAVTIEASNAPAGQEFKRWNITPSVTFISGDLTSASAVFAMPAQPVTVRAIFEAVVNEALVALTARVDQLKDLQQGGYTDESWDVFETALQQAKQVADGTDCSQDQIEKALRDLNNAFSALKVDNTKYIHLWGAKTGYKSNFVNWVLCIVLFGWIWMAF